MKKITLFGLSLAGLALLAFPHSGQAFELKEEWVVKCGVQYQDGKILRFNNGHEVDIKVLDLPKNRENRVDGQSQWSRSDSQFSRPRKGQVYDWCRGTLPEFLCSIWL